MALIAGQQGTITYLTFAGGQPFNPMAGGGQVLSQALYPTAARTGLPVATASQIVQTTTGAVLTYTVPVAGLYYALTQWQPSAGAPVVVDSDDTVTVASFTGNLGPAAIVTLAEVKAALNIRPEQVSKDPVVAQYIAAATEVCDYHCGPTIPRVVTETIRTLRDSGSYYGATSLWPQQRPVLAVNGITDLINGQASDVRLLDDGSVFTVNMNGTGPWQLSYTVGRTTVPEDLKRGLIELIRWTYSSGERAAQAGQDPQAGGLDFFTQERVQTRLGFNLPPRVRDWWSPFLRKDGFA